MSSVRVLDVSQQSSAATAAPSDLVLEAALLAEGFTPTGVVRVELEGQPPRHHQVFTRPEADAFAYLADPESPAVVFVSFDAEGRALETAGAPSWPGTDLEDLGLYGGAAGRRPVAELLAHHRNRPDGPPGFHPVRHDALDIWCEGYEALYRRIAEGPPTNWPMVALGSAAALCIGGGFVVSAVGDSLGASSTVEVGGFVLFGVGFLTLAAMFPQYVRRFGR